MRAKGGVMVPSVLSEDWANWDKNRGVMKAMHRIENRERCQDFPERVGPRILLLESVHYFGTSDSSVVEKKNNFHEQNFDGEDNWSGVVNFHCMQVSLLMSRRFIFGDDWNDAKCSSRFLDLRQCTVEPW